MEGFGTRRHPCSTLNGVLTESVVQAWLRQEFEARLFKERGCRRGY